MQAGMRQAQRTIPEFVLYGESRHRGTVMPKLHVEEIQSRSRKYQWHISPHRHTELAQCVFVSAGPAAIRMEERLATLQGPALALLAPGSVHAFQFTGDTQGFVLTLSAAELSGSGGDELDAASRALFVGSRVLRLEANGTVPARLARLFAQLLDEFGRPGSAAAPVCTWLARALLWIVAHEVLGRARLEPRSLHHHQQFERFRALLETHYLRHWPVGRYAQALGLTSARLTRLCVAVAGHSAFALIQRRLALEARRQLTYTALSVVQLALQLGFPDSAYFCRFFRRHARLSPRQFRRASLQPGAAPVVRESRQFNAQ
jgi:AraC family transcriptional activator of pobA